MRFPDEAYNLRVEVDANHCELTPDLAGRLSEGLRPLDEVVRDFPVSDLLVTIDHFPRSGVYRIKAALRVPSRTLFTAERHELMESAFRSCIRKLVSKVEEHKQQLSQEAEHRRISTGKRHEVVPTVEPDLAAIQESVSEGDYRGFREQMVFFEDAIRARVGRWVQRFPDVEARVGAAFTVDDFVEEVFLNAFDRFERRPNNALSEWLATLIDDSVHALAGGSEIEKENVSFARTLTETRDDSP